MLGLDSRFLPETRLLGFRAGLRGICLAVPAGEAGPADEAGPAGEAGPARYAGLRTLNPNPKP